MYAWLVAYREARGEQLAGQVAVVYVLVTRAARRSWYGGTIAECATKKLQFSSLTDPKDPQLAKAWPTLSTPEGLATARAADEVLRGAVGNPFPGADHYHDISIPSPDWTKGAKFCGQTGRLRFYDVDQDTEAPQLVAADLGPDFDKKLRDFLSAKGEA